MMETETSLTLEDENQHDENRTDAIVSYIDRAFHDSRDSRLVLSICFIVCGIGGLILVFGNFFGALRVDRGSARFMFAAIFIGFLIGLIAQLFLIFIRYKRTCKIKTFLADILIKKRTSISTQRIAETWAKHCEDVEKYTKNFDAVTIICYLAATAFTTIIFFLILC